MLCGRVRRRLRSGLVAGFCDTSRAASHRGAASALARKRVEGQMHLLAAAPTGLGAARALLHTCQVSMTCIRPRILILGLATGTIDGIEMQRSADFPSARH